MCVPKAVPRKARWPDCTCVAAPGRQPPRACRGSRACVYSKRTLTEVGSVSHYHTPTNGAHGPHSQVVGNRANIDREFAAARAPLRLA